MFVLDASAALAWCFRDEANALAEAVFDLLLTERATVPAIWPFEVANVLLAGQRRGRLSPAEASNFIRIVNGLPISVESGAGVDRALGPVLALAREQGLSVYDASYLDLALGRGLALATLDFRLQAAATRLAVPVVGLG